MTTKKEHKICVICKDPIHKENLVVVDGQCIHHICWEELLNETSDAINKDLKQQESEIQRKANRIGFIIKNAICLAVVIMIVKIIMKVWSL